MLVKTYTTKELKAILHSMWSLVMYSNYFEVYYHGTMWILKYVCFITVS